LLATKCRRNTRQDGAQFELDVRYAVEQLRRGGGLRFAAEHLPHRDARFFTLNGDALARFDPGELRQAHEAAGAIATTAPARHRLSWGS
jgi:NDP-sugar pyrophosphorylase family protein